MYGVRCESYPDTAVAHTSFMFEQFGDLDRRLVKTYGHSRKYKFNVREIGQCEVLQIHTQAKAEDTERNGSHLECRIKGG